LNAKRKHKEKGCDVEGAVAMAMSPFPHSSLFPRASGRVDHPGVAQPQEVNSGIFPCHATHQCSEG